MGENRAGGGGRSSPGAARLSTTRWWPPPRIALVGRRRGWLSPVGCGIVGAMTAPAPTVLVTGATDGIGRETALELARRGARVIVHGRREAAARAVVEAIRAAGRTGAAEPLLADLASLAEARGLARVLAERGERVDVLVNNAGVYMNERSVTGDGFELTIAVNHLAPFVLTHALLDSPAGASLRRIVNVSSMAHSRGAIDLADLSFERRPFEPYAAYAQSKLANVLFSTELARRLAARGVTANALHPGVVSTKLLTEGFGVRGSDSLAKGARTSVRLALDEDVAAVTGQYFVDGAIAPSSRAARDAELARALYDASARMTQTPPLP